ncbi:MAG: hypothetical protein ACREJ6_09900, partial [Candidatus Methylomirabilis sp.]
RGDGVGYYAYVRSLLIDGDLRFENEWRAGNPTFTMGRVNPDGSLKADQYSPTGYVKNIWSVGPAILWAPFLLLAHLFVLALHGMSFPIPADGYSLPYTLAMAFATALYGFLALLISFRLARSYFATHWALLGTLGIWFASSLPVYMYLNPSWSHAHSAFAVALFLWYWHRTRADRTTSQWVVLGLLSGLMLNVYYPNATLLVVPLVETLHRGYRALLAHPPDRRAMPSLLGGFFLFGLATLVAFLPTLITRYILFGPQPTLGYYNWRWVPPAFWDVLFSARHGLLSWTPILIPALLGLVALRRQDRDLASCLALAVIAFYVLIAFYPDWHGISSFGNRFFVSLTPFFVLGLAASFSEWGRWLGNTRLSLASAVLIGLSFIVWNAGFVFQWATRMVPAREAISWRQMAYNQFHGVPGRTVRAAREYLLSRRALLDRVEQSDYQGIRERARTEPGK